MRSERAVKSRMTFLPDNEQIDFVEGEEITVLSVALGADIPLGHSCGGNGYCTTCRVVIESELRDLPERGEIEQEAATDRGFRDDERLACQLAAINGLVVRRPGA